MHDTALFKNSDLLLRVTRNIDPGIFASAKYEPFLDALCGEREYQRQAILSVSDFLFGGAYPDLRALAEENYNMNPHLQEKYGDFPRMAAVLEFPDRLACSVDLAT